MNTFGTRMFFAGIITILLIGCHGTDQTGFIPTSTAPISSTSAAPTPTNAGTPGSITIEPTPAPASSYVHPIFSLPVLTPTPAPVLTGQTPTPTPVPVAPTPTPALVVPTSTPVPTPALAIAISFYSYADNAPAGTAIAYPQTSYSAAVHNSAGGTGTYADPVTLSSDIAEFPVGTRFYIASLQKYFVMEDDCPSCDQAWSANQSRLVNIWIGGNSSSSVATLGACESTLHNLVNTNGAWAYVNPPAAGLTVDTTPLFNTASNTCY
jgi:hypothetical protein